MSLSDNFQEQAGALAQKIRDMAPPNHVWKEDLEMALSFAEYTEEQLQAIHDAATPTVFSSILNGDGVPEESSITERLTHSFTDPIYKTAFALDFGKSDEALSLNVLINAKQIFNDIQHNYPLLIPKEDMPGTVEAILEEIRNEVIPQVDEMIDHLSDKTGINPEDIPQERGWEHIYELPEAVFE